MKALLVLLFAPVVFTCEAPRSSGDSSCGEPSGQKFYFDRKSGICQPFYYKGCNGNDNRFDSRDLCLKACKGSKTTTEHESIERCSAGHPVAVDGQNKPLSCDKCPKGYSCEEGKCCASKEHTCSLEYDAGKFGASGHHTPMYFYSPKFKACMIFTYYGTLGNSNNFVTHNECVNFCKGK